MAKLFSIAELAWRQLFPAANDETKVKREQFEEDAKTEYAFQMWLRLLNEYREFGEIIVPSYLVTETELEVKDDVMDLSGIKVMRGLPFELWIQNIGGVNCTCRYVKSTLNNAQVLCDDDSLDDADKIYYAVGKKLKFPRGVHKSPLPITYANYGENVDGDIEVDDAIGNMVRQALVNLYGGKVDREDKTNNSSSDT